MPQISQSVGSGGRNDRDDVKTVQKLLNQWSEQIPIRPLAVDGFCGERTIVAITMFQSRVMSMLHPDARVDPGGRTIGALNRGSLNLVGLPADGVGYYAYAESKHQFGTAKTIDSVKRAGRLMRERNLEFGVGHISLRHGGRFPPHRSHQSGTDVDIRPLRRDNHRNRVTITEAAYSSANTAQLVKILQEDPNLKGILFNDQSISGVLVFSGHDNHLHVKFLA